MFKHRLSKFGRASLFAACMLLVGGSMNSCQDKLDDYKYDDEEPTWLGASIYDFLKEGTPGHTYNNFVALIDSLGETETLAHTGSKTLFVADDAAFDEFYRNNPWGVTSVADMSKAQMKILLYSAMLDNTLQLDMLSSTGATAGSEGTCLRRTTSASVIDSVPLLDRNLGKSIPTYNKYWDALRGKGNAEKLRIAMDGTDAMMVHILGDYLKNNAIEASDIEFLFRKKGVQTKTYTNDEVLVFGNKLVASDVATDGFSDDTMTITCKNGSVFRLDGVLLPPSNMAQELRNREDTRIFSHLLDRFCIPVYDEALTAEYRANYKTEDSIFTLRYFVKDRFTNHNLLNSSNSNPINEELLGIDPGWNAFANSLAKERDMAAMFVPNDEVLYEYFASPNGAGNFLLVQFAPNADVSDINSLLSALDSVPEKNIAPFISNLMKSTFVGSVLSKFDRVTDDANDPMGIKEEHVDECVIANNGVIYILNNVFGPAKYQAVSAPTLVFENMMIMGKLVEQLRYDYYLLAMDADYSFIVPDDNYFVYYDPITFGTDEPKIYSFHYNSERPKGNGAVELWADIYKFNPKTYEITDTLTPMTPVNLTGTNFNGNAFMKNRMTDLLEYLIVVHGEEGQFVADKKYYQTKGYGFMKVDASDESNLKIYGGEQIENGSYVAVGSRYTQKNGYTYCTVPGNEDTEYRKYSGIPTPPTKNVYDNMYANAQEEQDLYYEFFELCEPDGLSELLKTIYPKASTKALNDTTKLYSIFYTSTDGKMQRIVPFFNIFHYTVYIPSNSAIKDVYAQGLPTWDDVKAYAAEYPEKAMSMLRQLNSFIRYHFQDNSVFYESGRPFSIPSTVPGNPYYEANFSTALINNKTGRFYETTVKSNSDNSTITVTDQMGNVAEVLVDGEEGKTYNVMARDIEYTVNNSAQKIPSSIYSSSFSVLQPISRVLLNDGLFGHDGNFRRYASSGEPVDTMSVPGYSEPYLVASSGSYKIESVDGTEKMMRTGYLMAPIDESNELWDANFAKEDFILKDGEKIRITNEGIVIAINSEKKLAPVIEESEEGKYMLKVDSNGDVVERIPYTE
ncbi:MAG: hypothetical protein IKU76_01520 [Bacteroidaceae bacterium]|nr:hypothetical protein [Bacteroidaceae bacterium]